MASRGKTQTLFISFFQTTQYFNYQVFFFPPENQNIFDSLTYFNESEQTFILYFIIYYIYNLYIILLVLLY